MWVRNQIFEIWRLSNQYFYELCAAIEIRLSGSIRYISALIGRDQTRLFSLPADEIELIGREYLKSSWFDFHTALIFLQPTFALSACNISISLTAIASAIDLSTHSPYFYTAAWDLSYRAIKVEKLVWVRVENENNLAVCELKLQLIELNSKIIWLCARSKIEIMWAWIRNCGCENWNSAAMITIFYISTRLNSISTAANHSPAYFYSSDFETALVEIEIKWVIGYELAIIK